MVERFGTRRLAFHHPSGIEYELVEVGGDLPQPWTGSDIPCEIAVREFMGSRLQSATIAR